MSHFGKHEDFTEKLSVLVDTFENLKEGLVFINDGAVWIANFIKEHYPNATDILDFYVVANHASEYLHGFSKAVFTKKTEETERKQWVNGQILDLLNDRVDKVIGAIGQMSLKGKTKIGFQQKILDYYTNNKHRMLYKSYRDKGLLIGSGPIESAHRFVLQKKNETIRSKMD